MKTQSSNDDAEKLERLYNTYRLIMLKEAYAVLQDYEEAEDALHQAFIKISSCVKKIKEDNRAMTCNFMKVVARNAAKDLYRKKLYLNSDDNADELIDDAVVHKSSSVAQMVINKESIDRIMKAIMELPEIYRDVILMEKIQGYSREETMKLLNANNETIKKRITRAKAKLLEALREEEQ